MAGIRTEAGVTGLFDQAVSTFGDALKAGVKIQEEVGKFWTDALDQGSPVQEWQKRSRALVAEAIPTAQRSAEEWLKLVERNYQKSMVLMKKAFESDQMDPNELRARAQELWEESLELVRDNAQAMAQANVKMLEIWAGLLKKNVNGDVAKKN
jgi:hypothetical protein